MTPSRPLSLLLNIAHALDHLFLLVFATAVTSIAADFGFARWEDLMPFGVGAFAAIYHPVGIPMLVQNAARPGATIGVNGLAGNLGIAATAIVTGFLVKH